MLKRKTKLLLAGWLGLFVSGITISAAAQSTEQATRTMEELKLPDPLVCLDGSLVRDVETWQQKRRPEVLKLMTDHVYGRVPDKQIPVEFRVVKEWPIFDHTATCREVDLVFGDLKDRQLTARLLLFLPKADHPVGCFVGLNFGGNHTVSADPEISLTTSWVRNRKDQGTADNLATEQSRGTAASRWPAEVILKRGYALATMYYGDIDPDFDDDFQNGIHALFNGGAGAKPAKQEWGSIAAWAWSLGRMVDYLQTEPAINAQQFAVIGHSRLGKTALWAGATDPRFRIVISNDSGCGGAALSRRRYGETVARINKSFPHWFCDQFCEYDDNEDQLPVDQHLLIALMAPRAVYVASATEDQWADPIGEYQSLVGASSVYALFGNPPVSPDQPLPDRPVRFGKIGYHLRTGKHDIQLYDWENYLEFADKELGSGK